MALRGVVELALLRFVVRRQWLVRALDPLIGMYNPFLQKRQRDPHAHYRRLRERAPVYKSPALGVSVLTRYADVLHVLRDPVFSVQRFESSFMQRVDLFRGVPEEVQEPVRRSMLMLDPPDHTRLRGLVSKAFTARRIEALRPRIQALTDELLDALARKDEIELVRDFAHPLPVIVIAELLGVPPEDRERIRRWSNDLATIVDPAGALAGLKALVPSFMDAKDYIDGLVAERRRAPRDDLLSALVAAEERGDVLNEAEMFSTITLLLGAGHETTTSLLGNAVWTLLRHPGERKRLQDDPSLIESAVEELLRFESPVQATDRFAREDTEIAGHRIAKGRTAVLLLGAANRDPARFPEPDRLDLGREDNRHLAFGNGVHFCLGAQLARVEAQIALPALLRRFPDLAGDPQRVRWRPSMTLRGPAELPLRLH